MEEKFTEKISMDILEIQKKLDNRVRQNLKEFDTIEFGIVNFYLTLASIELRLHELTDNSGKVPFDSRKLPKNVQKYFISKNMTSNS